MFTASVFFLGMLFGAALMWLAFEASRRRVTRPHLLDPHYEPAKRAVIRHLRTHGTVNLGEVQRMMDIAGMTALRYLDQMVHDRLLKQHGHRGAGAFYTLP